MALKALYDSSVWLCGLNYKCYDSGHINLFVNLILTVFEHDFSEKFTSLSEQLCFFFFFSFSLCFTLICVMSSSTVVRLTLAGFSFCSH